MSYRYRILLAVLSGLLFAISIIFIVLPFSFVAFVPLLISINNLNIKKALFTGFISGLSTGLFTSFWMLESLASFAGMPTALSVYLFAVLLIGLMMTLGTLILYPFMNSRLPIIVKSMGIASIWTLFEFFICNMVPGAFWFHPNLYKGVLKSGLLLQAAVFGGGLLISFFCAWINASLAIFLLDKRKQPLIWLIVLVGSYIGLCYTAKLVYPLDTTRATAKVALINANHPLHMQWDESTGDHVVREMLQLNKAAYATQSQLHIWTESIVPWSFRKDDDLVLEILKNPEHHKTGHIIGLLTDHSSDNFYNSAYYIEDINGPVQRYDKQYPLIYSEAPVTLFSLPLFSSPGFNIIPGRQDVVFNTLAGKAGITICNEALVDKVFYQLPAKGAEFLVVISNDGWIANSYLLQQHFYSSRLHAVESRRDLLINSNLGYSGGFNGMGQELVKAKEEAGFVRTVPISKNKQLTFYSKNYYFFLYVYLLFTVLLLTILFIQKIKKKPYEKQLYPNPIHAHQ